MLVTTERASLDTQFLLLLNMFCSQKKDESFCPSGKKNYLVALASGIPIKRWHLIGGTHILPRNSKNQKHEDSDVQDVAHFN